MKRAEMLLHAARAAGRGGSTSPHSSGSMELAELTRIAAARQEADRLRHKRKAALDSLGSLGDAIKARGWFPGAAAAFSAGVDDAEDITRQIEANGQ